MAEFSVYDDLYYIYYEIVLRGYKKNLKNVKNHMVDKYEINKKYFRL